MSARAAHALRWTFGSSRAALWLRGALGCAFGAASALALVVRCGYVSRAHDVALTAADVSLGDALLLPFVGDPASLSVEWAAACVLFLACASLEASDAHPAALVSCGSRWRWWRSLCAAAVLRALLPLLVGAACCALFAAALGCDLALGPSALEQLSLWGVRAGQGPADTACLLLLLALGFSALALVQLALSLAIGGAGAFLGVTALTLGSAFAPGLPLPGSLLMASRLGQFAAGRLSVASAWPIWLGAAVFASLGLAAFCAGGAAFCSLDVGLGRVRR